MSDEIYDTLLRFHREVFLPDLRRVVQEQPKHDDFDQRIKATIFNGQLQGLEVEHYLLASTVERLEAEQEGIVYPWRTFNETRAAVRNHLEGLANHSLQERLHRLQVDHSDLSRRVAALEPRLDPASRRIYDPQSNLAELGERMSTLLANR